MWAFYKIDGTKQHKVVKENNCVIFFSCPCHEKNNIIEKSY